MAAQRSRWLFLSLSLVLIFYIRDLLGQTSGRVVEGTTQTHSVQVITYFSRHGRLVACSKMNLVIERDMSFSVSRFSKMRIIMCGAEDLGALLTGLCVRSYEWWVLVSS